MKGRRLAASRLKPTASMSREEVEGLRVVARRPWGLARRLGEFARGWLGEIKRLVRVLIQLIF